MLSEIKSVLLASDSSFDDEVYMMSQIKESDWKVFNEVHRIAEERACQRAIDDIEALLGTHANAAERFLAVHELVIRRVKELRCLFDDMRGSSAVNQLGWMHAHDLVSDDELSRFSPEVRRAARDFQSTKELQKAS